MAFCQGVLQLGLPATHSELRGVGINSHGCKQGCFQPPGPGGSDPSRRSGFAGHAPGPMVQQHNGSKVHPRLGRRRTLSGWNEVYEPAILWGGGSAGCSGLRPRNGRAVQQPSGLGRHGSAPGGRRTLRSAQRTRGLAPCTLCGELLSAIGRVSPGLTGRMGVRPGLNIPYPTGPTNCLARTRSTGSHRGTAMSGRRGCPTPAVSPRSTGSC